MKWKVSRIVAALLIAVALVYEDRTMDGTLGMLFCAGLVALALFQAFVWVSYDMITMRKGVWQRPDWEANPFRSRWPMSTSFLALAGFFLGVIYLLISPVLGLEAMFFGCWVIAGAIFLHSIQHILCKAFAARFPA